MFKFKILRLGIVCKIEVPVPAIFGRNGIWVETGIR